MKLELIQLLVITALGITAHSHAQTIEALDVNKADIQIVSINPDKGKHASIYVGAFGPEGVNFIGTSYYKPKTMYLNAMAGSTGGMIDGSFLFNSNIKERELKQSKKAGTVIKYAISTSMQQRKSLGLHLGANYVNYSSLNVTGVNSFSTNGVFGGITLLSSRHAHWKVDSDRKEVQGTSIGRINADVIYYINRKLFPAEGGKEQGGIDQVSRKVGFRLYLDGKTSVWSRKGRIAIHYMAGLGRNSDRSRDVAPFGGIGIGYNFL